MGSVMADFVWSRGRRSRILLECSWVGIMSLFQIGMYELLLLICFEDDVDF